MNDVIYPTRPAKCHDCPRCGRAWCLDGEGYPACEREDVDFEDEDIHGFIPEGLFDGSEDEEDELFVLMVQACKSITKREEARNAED